MAQIDVTQIAGFEEMTAEQKLDALMKLEVPDKVDLSGYVKKSVFDAKAAEASDLSKKLKGKMTEDEQKQAEIAEAAEAAAKEKETMLARIAELEKNNEIRECTIGFSGLGFDETLAADAANQFEAKDRVKFFVTMKKFLESYEKAIEKKLMDSTPGPGGNAGKDDGKDKAVEFAKSIYGKKQGESQSYNDILNRYKK